MRGEARDSVRQSARPVIELDFGILVYPPASDGEPWRAVFTENGQRKYRQWAADWRDSHERLEDLRQWIGEGPWAQALAQVTAADRELVSHLLTGALTHDRRP